MDELYDLNVREIVPFASPAEYRSNLPLSDELAKRIVQGRRQIQQIISGKDQRMLIIVGPCSVHDREAALDYAEFLAELSKKVKDRLLLVMRVYFEKPRTTIGWRGLLNDPGLNGHPDPANGFLQVRKLLLEIGSLGVLTATEWLDPIAPQYLADLVSWGAIGARTCESQPHRQMASGLSMPIGFKNSTEGNVRVAIDAIVAAGSPQVFMGINPEGLASAVFTKGNSWAHLILRGGARGPNYDAFSIAEAIRGLETAGVCPWLVIDCSHGNSEKDHRNQSIVFRAVLEQRLQGNANIVGLMLESNLFEGRQESQDPANLVYGVSITDACIGWQETEELLLEAHRVL